MGMCWVVGWGLGGIVAVLKEYLREEGAVCVTASGRRSRRGVPARGQPGSRGSPSPPGGGTTELPGPTEPLCAGARTQPSLTGRRGEGGATRDDKPSQ